MAVVMTTETRFLEGDEFTSSLRNLYQKGGLYQKAAKTVQAAWGLAHSREPFEEVFKGIPTTNHGESRIPHCIKYDLTKFARLVTVVNNGICLFLFCGDHDTVDKWLDRNKGLDFVARRSGETLVLQKTRASNPTQGVDGWIAANPDLSTGALLDLLPTRYIERIFDDLPSDVLTDVRRIESISSDDEIQNVALICGDEARRNTVLDVLLSLRSGDVVNAKVRIDTWAGKATPVIELQEQQVSQIESSESTVLIEDVDPVLFQHFVQTASFEQWMLYLHPAQRQHVQKDFDGPARLAGVSGSGKTCVIVHRALRLADLYKEEPVLIVTLNDALASLINGLIDAARGESRPKNIQVSSIFELCFQKLMDFEPEKRDYYTTRTIAKNPHAITEEVDEIWREYFLCENNNHDADSMLEVVQTLSVRGIYASDYLRQELDYVRSRFRPGYRQEYLDMEREGRVVGLEERYRLAVLDGLDGWEKKMKAVGVVDGMGIVTALSRHVKRLEPTYRCVLVDEVQDLGTLELTILRKLTKEGPNDLFLCGDPAQRIYTKHADLTHAGIDTTGRSALLKQNYRNSRQILTAAYAVLTRSLEGIPRGATNVEVLPPEYASFASPKPLLIQAGSIEEEIAYGLGYLKSLAESTGTTQRYCLAVCGYTQSAVERLGSQLGIQALCARTNLREAQVFISDLEQTKGFEFDAVVLMNCTSAVMPHPQLPEEESFRDLSRLYVAMTRAKTQLLVSYSGALSTFLEAARDTFTDTTFQEHVEPLEIGQLQMPTPAIPKRHDPEMWSLNGQQFLKTLDATGLPRVVQDIIATKVSGVVKLQGAKSKQTEWNDFESFYSTMQDPRKRHMIISEESWRALYQHFG